MLETQSAKAVDPFPLRYSRNAALIAERTGGSTHDVIGMYTNAPLYCERPSSHMKLIAFEGL
jgi:hypothetical protein